MNKNQIFLSAFLCLLMTFLSFNINSQTYCTAAGSAGTGGDFFNRIRFFQGTASIISLTTAKTTGLYSDSTNIVMALQKGVSYTIETRLATEFGGDTTYAWIDYNDNKVFESSELIHKKSNGVASGTSNSLTFSSFTIPNTVSNGPKRLRIRNSFGANGNNPCGNSISGDVDDYTIIVGDYCPANGTQGTGADWIKNVSIFGINNPSLKTQYSDFSATSTNLMENRNYTLSVLLNAVFASDTIIGYIDWNDNKTFESTERVLLGAAVSSTVPTTATVTVPAGTATGPKRMRIRGVFGSSTSHRNYDACYLTAGEAEDYTINVIEESNTYPQAEGKSGTGADYITNFSFGNVINNSTAKTSYTFVKESTLPKVKRDSTYNMSITLANVFPQDTAYAYIDWNANKVFEANERVTFSSFVSTRVDGLRLPATATATVAVPGDAAIGETVLRARVVFGNNNNYDPNGSYFGEVEDYAINVVASLPVKLTSFTAYYIENESIALNWESVSEINFSRYEIQRSANGINFEKIGTLEASLSRNDKKEYSFLDNNPLPSYNYYRLKMVDLDGTFEFSKIISQRYANDLKNVEVFYASNLIQMRSNLESYNAKIYNAGGQLVYPKTNFSGSSSIEVDQLTEGIYFIQIDNGLSIETKKFVKL